MKTKRDKRGADVSENTPPQDEPSFRNSPRTRRTSLLDITAPSPVFQRRIISNIVKKKVRPILNKSLPKIREDNIVSSPASPLLGRRRPTSAKKLAISSLEPYINSFTSEGISRLSPEKENTENILRRRRPTSAKKLAISSLEPYINSFTSEGISRLSPEKENTENITVIKESPHVSPPLLVRNSTVNLMSPPLSERKNFQNEIQNNVQNKEPVKRKARNVQSNLDKENIILKPVEIEVPVKRTRRANALTDISSQESVYNLENDIIDVVKRRTRGKKGPNTNENVGTIANLVENVTNQHKSVVKKSSGRKIESEVNKEEKTKESSDLSVSEGKKENTSSSKGKKGAYSRKKNVMNDKTEEIKDPIIEPSIPIVPRRGRRAAVLETKITEKQTKITEKQTKITEKLTKITEKQTKITEKQTKITESQTKNPEKQIKGSGKQTKSTRKQPKIDSFLLSQSLQNDSVTPKTDMKNTQSKVNINNKKTKQLKADVNKSLSGDVTLSPKINKSQGTIANSPSISGSIQNIQKLPIWASVANKKTKEDAPGSRKSHRRSMGSGHKDVFEFSFDVETDVNLEKKKKRVRKPRVKKEKPKSTLKPTLLVTDPSWQKPLPHSRKKNASPYSGMKDTISTSVSKSISKKEALTAKLREKKKVIENSILSQESNATSGYSSQTPKQSTSQESSYIKHNRAPEHNFIGFSGKSHKRAPEHSFIGFSGKSHNKVRDIPEINFDDDDEGCDIHANDFDDCETDVVERLEYETTSSFRPPMNALMSDSVLPTPVVSSRMFSKFIVGASTPMANHVKPSNIFRDPEPPKTVVEDVEQCFGFDDEIESNPLNISPVRNSFVHSTINSCLEVTGMTVHEEDGQPSRFDFGSIYRGNRSNITASMNTHGRSIASVSTSISNSRMISKNVSKQKMNNKKSPAPTGSIKNYISTSKKSPSSTKGTKISGETLSQENEPIHPAENAMDNSVLFDEEPLEEVSKPLKEVGRKSLNNTKRNEIIPVSEVPSPEKSFTKPANKIYDRRSLNESRQRFLRMHSGADASNFGDNEEDEDLKKSKKQKSSAKSKKSNSKGKKATIKSVKEKASTKVLAKRACKDTRKVNFDSSGDSTLDSSQEEEKRVKKKTKKEMKLDKSAEDWASDINSHFSEVEDIELVIG